MIEFVLNFFSKYLIEIMGLQLIGALVFRWFAFKQTKDNEAYFLGFVREVDNIINHDRVNKVSFNDPESYLTDILGRANKKMPNRNVRFGQGISINSKDGNNTRREMLNLRDFVSSKEGLMANILAESSVFNSKTPPDFDEVTFRILDQDKHWTKIITIVPIEWVSRMIDILPNLFIVFGVFGTFIGIAMALPEIANIDFSNLEGSQATLTAFVLSVTFAMKTSIAGIFFSLIVTFLNTLFPINDMRDRIFKGVENCFQNMWYHIRRDHSNLSTEQLLSELLKEVKNISRRSTGPKKEVDEKVKKIANALNKTKKTG